MTKTVKKLLLLFLLILPILTACSATNTNATTTTTSTTSTATIADVTSGDAYNLTLSELQDYLATIDQVSPVYTAALVMPNVVEVTYTVDYTYTQTYMTPFGPQTQNTSNTLTSQATAFFINADGYLVTNAHVVSLEDYKSYSGFTINSATLSFNFADSDQQFTASIVDYNTSLDLAVLKSDTTFTDQSYLTFFDITADNPLYYGESVLAVGNAQGYGLSVTSGIVSAPIRYFDQGSTTAVAIQTDAAINEGNSGGPLTNLYGAVLGIDSFKIVTDTSEGLGYAIPSNIVMGYLDSLNLTYSTTAARAYLAN